MGVDCWCWGGMFLMGVEVVLVFYFGNLCVWLVGCVDGDVVVCIDW